MNIPGWRTKRKIVVIESDDWGAIRLPSRDILSQLKKAGINSGTDHYIRNDSLASETDLSNLFDVLSSVEDKSGHAAKLTANTIMANPDFMRIRESNLKEYHFEIFTDTFKRYPEHTVAFELWKEGIGHGVFKPQFHGREHLQVGRWLKGLADPSSETFKAFEHDLYALCTSSTSEKRKSYMAAWEWDNEEDRQFNLNSVEDGLNIFEDIFGYRSRSAIAPNYTWNREVEIVLRDGGVRYLQGASVQRSPEIGEAHSKSIRHFTGQKNELGQIYSVRNCRFEPTSEPGKDWVESCMREIRTAFRWNKPAIIESHRVNFVGFINPRNRDQNLKLFRELLLKITQTWPDVEFMSSDQLGAEIEEG